MSKTYKDNKRNVIKPGYWKGPPDLIDKNVLNHNDGRPGRHFWYHDAVPIKTAKDILDHREDDEIIKSIVR
jgi:hypothetical protein